MDRIIVKENQAICLGMVGEDLATRVSFDKTEFTERIGEGGSFEVIAVRPGDASAYPVANISEDSSFLNWDVGIVDTAREGIGEVQVVYRNGGTVLSNVHKTVIKRSLADVGTIPEPWVPWIYQANLQMNVIRELLSKKMEYYKLEVEYDYPTQRYFIVHEDERLGYAEVKAMFDAPDVFEYMDYANVIMIPAMDIKNSAIAFTGAWCLNQKYDDSEEETYQQPYLERVIINNADEVKISQLEIETAYNRITSDIASYEHLAKGYQDKCYPSVGAVIEYVKSMLNV